MVAEAVIIAILSHGEGIATRLDIETEARIIVQVAAQYELTPYETRLLAVIRRIENGRAGCEYGVGSEDPNHPARRKADDAFASCQLQAEWAAGTIKRRYSGDIDTFAARWCPGDKTWARNAAWYLGREWK